MNRQRTMWTRLCSAIALLSLLCLVGVFGTHAAEAGTVRTFTVTFSIESTIPFNAVQATVTLPPGATVESLEPGTCGLTFLFPVTPQDPSFVGAILGGQSTSCTVYTLDLSIAGPGSPVLGLSDVRLISRQGAMDILSSASCGAVQCVIRGE